MDKNAGNLLVIAGTDTDAGKTIVTAGLLRAVSRLGVSIQAIKPIQTGCVPLPDGAVAVPDVNVYQDACPKSEALSFCRMMTPCSPHLAASLEKREISAAELSHATQVAAQNNALTLVEGAGGLLVPINAREMLIDVFAMLDAPVLLVAANRLGAINHTLLSLETLRSRGLEIAGLILVETTREKDVLEKRIRQSNYRFLSDDPRFPFVAALPYAAGLSSQDAKTRAEAWDGVAKNLRETAERLFSRGEFSDRRTCSLQKSIDIDRKHLWHPYATTTPSPHVWLVERTMGATIQLADGRNIVDGMSSWWAAIHGYNHPTLLEALRAQAAKMPHIMFGGLTHTPAALLAEKLLELVPKGLERIFFCDSGSVAVEVAVKMALQFQGVAHGGARNFIAAPLGGYHGDTLGAMSVCDPVTGMHHLFKRILPQQIFFERPSSRFDAEFKPESLRSMNDIFARHGHELAAVIIEPIVQGAGGMWFYHPEYLKQLRALCSAYSVLLIFDEIATGFGRTGKMFAAEWAGVTPDILCVGKALTGGVMSLAAVIAKEELAETISQNGVFMHGPTFMANPLSCAVAKANLDLLTSSPWEARILNMEKRLKEGLAPCKRLPGVQDVRVLGGIGVVEMHEPVNVDRLQRFFVDVCGVWIRPFSRLIYVMPPYNASASELSAIISAITRAVEGMEWE